MQLRAKPFVLQAWRGAWRHRSEVLRVELPVGRHALQPEALQQQLRRSVDEFLGAQGASNPAGVDFKYWERVAPNLYRAGISGPSTRLSGAKGRWEAVVWEFAIASNDSYGGGPSLKVSMPEAQIAQGWEGPGRPAQVSKVSVLDDRSIAYWHRRLFGHLSDAFLAPVK